MTKTDVGVDAVLSVDVGDAPMRQRQYTAPVHAPSAQAPHAVRETLPATGRLVWRVTRSSIAILELESNPRSDRLAATSFPRAAGLLCRITAWTPPYSFRASRTPSGASRPKNNDASYPLVRAAAQLTVGCGAGRPRHTAALVVESAFQPHETRVRCSDRPCPAPAHRHAAQTSRLTAGRNVARAFGRLVRCNARRRRLGTSTSFELMQFSSVQCAD